MAKRGRSGMAMDGLAEIAASIQAKRDALMVDVDRLDRILKEMGSSSGGGRGKARRSTGGGTPGARAPKEGSLGGRILAALSGGPLENSAIMDKAKIPTKKRTQLSVTLNSLKKRGFVKSPSRGTWAAA